MTPAPTIPTCNGFSVCINKSCRRNLHIQKAAPRTVNSNWSTVNRKQSRISRSFYRVMAKQTSGVPPYKKFLPPPTTYTLLIIVLNHTHPPDVLLIVIHTPPHQFPPP